MESGLSYEDCRKDRYIHDDEAVEIRRLLNEAASNKACLTMKEAIRVVSIVVAARKMDVYFGKTISEITIRR